MTPQEAFANLRTILARLYPDPQLARVVVRTAGLNAQHISFSNTTTVLWDSILTQAENEYKMDALFKVVQAEFPNNRELQQAIEDYRNSTQGATSTSPAASTSEARIHVEIVIKILFLAANPTDTTALRLGEESRSIDRALRQAEYRDRFDLEQAHAVQVQDLAGLLMRYKPHIVHFSGHGSQADEIIFEDEAGRSQPVSPRALSRVFALLKDNIRCVVLNACYSKVQAEAIAEHIDCVVGMSAAISDRAAISFAASFYQALGYGRDVETAFELGRAQIDLENIPEDQTPQLLATKVDPKQVTLIS